MAETTLLKDQFGPEVPRFIADGLSAVDPDFDADGFMAQALAGFEELELTARARHVSAALADHLPEDRGRALELILAALPPRGREEQQGMKGFRYLPYVYFVADHGLDHFELAMRAQYELTRRFTAEFSIRPFLEQHRDATLARLREWAADPDTDVRRLVSEGTRPRLPWAGHLRAFQDDPSPVLELLELLKDDTEEYVRRSVANNLNDIAKDHPDTVLATARRWAADAGPERMKLIRHGLRSLVKQAHPEALSILGFEPDSPVAVRAVRVEPPTVAIGGRVRIEVDLHNPTADEQSVLVDLIVHFVKADGSTNPKVFKGAELHMDPGGRATVAKTVSVRQHTTRTHHPGNHRVEVQLNGAVHPGATFTLRP